MIRIMGFCFPQYPVSKINSFRQLKSDCLVLRRKLGIWNFQRNKKTSGILLGDELIKPAVLPWFLPFSFSWSTICFPSMIHKYRTTNYFIFHINLCKPNWVPIWTINPRGNTQETVITHFLFFGISRDNN